MFDTIADMLRGSAPDDLARALGTDRTQTRRAMEIGLPALITGLRDKTLEPGGAQSLAAMLEDSRASVPDDIGSYLSEGDPSRGAPLLDTAFGDRGESALSALSSASGLSTRLLAQVMSVLAPLATGTVANAATTDPEGLRSYLGSAVGDLEAKGFGRVVDLVSPATVEGGADVVPIDADSGDSGDEIMISADDDADLTVDIDGPDATVVEGAFPESLDTGLDPMDLDTGIDADLDAGLDVDLDGGSIDVGDAMPDFDADLASVAPAGVDIAAPDVDVDADATIALAEAPDLDADIDTGLPERKELELQGSGLSGMGWLWWLLGAVLGLIVLVFAISQCGGDDDGGVAATTTGTDATTTEPAATSTPDPLVAQRQATLNSILADYPNVQGEVIGEVAVLNGTVGNETERALLDQAVRGAGIGVQNNVTASEVVEAAVGYSLNDIIDAQPELSTLKSLLAEAGLGDALAGEGDFTLFAPTNAAFAAVADQVAELQADPTALQDVLRYHLLVGQQDSATLAGASTVATHLDGQSIDVTNSGGTILLNGSTQVLAADAVGRNGLMHIVDSVLLPNIAQPLPEEIGSALGLAPITFALGSSEITDAGKVELDKVVTFLLENPGNVEVGGHTDSDGDAGFNQTLSQDRANAVKDYLVANGVPTESLNAVGFGATQPLVANDTPENKARNRRIEFRPN